MLALRDVAIALKGLDVFQEEVHANALRERLALVVVGSGKSKMRVEDLTLDQMLDVVEMTASGQSDYAKAVNALSDAEFWSFGKAIKENLQRSVNFSTTTDELTTEQMVSAFQATARIFGES